MPETQDKNQDIIALLKEYIATRVELTRLSVIERVVVVAAALITDTFVVIMLTLTFLFGSLTLGFYLSEVLDSYAGGFGLLTLFYLLLALIVLFTKDKYVEKYLHGFMVKRIFKDKK
jgi:hypothetical protein